MSNEEQMEEIWQDVAVQKEFAVLQGKMIHIEHMDDIYTPTINTPHMSGGEQSQAR